MTNILQEAGSVAPLNIEALDAETLRFSRTSSYSHVQVELPATVKGFPTVQVSHALLQQFVGVMAGAVELDPSSRDRLVVRALERPRRFHIATLAEPIPLVLLERQSDEMRLPQAKLAEVMKRLKFALPPQRHDQPIGYYLMPHGGGVRAVVNGNVIAISTPVTDRITTSGMMFVPHFLQVVLGADDSEEEDVAVYRCGTQTVIEGGTFRMAGALPHHLVLPPPWLGLFDVGRQLPEWFTCERKSLLAALSAVRAREVFDTGGDDKVGMTAVELSVRDTRAVLQTADAYDEVELLSSKRSGKILINRGLLEGACKVATGDAVSVHCGADATAVWVTDGQTESMVALMKAV